MIYPQSQKPPIWSIDPGVLAYNCQKAGMPHPVLAMPMWEGAGNLARDYSGRGNHGTLTGQPDWVKDGLDFNGSTDYVENTTAPILSSDFTVSCWADVDITSSISSIFLGSKSSGISGWGFKAEQYNNTGRVGFTFFGVADYVTSITTPLGRAFYTAVYDTSSNTIDIYVNSNSEQLIVGTMGAPDINGIIIGAAQITSSSLLGFITGTTDNVYTFDTILSASQVKFLRENPWFMYQIPEELYGYVAAAPPVGNPFWYYNLLRRRN